MGVLQSEAMSRYLDPGSSLGEVLFGLIMTLTFTLGAGIIIEEEGREGVRTLLLATVGCNIAWGIIDGALYIVGQVFERGRLLRLGRSIRHTPDAGAARELVAGELDDMLEPVSRKDDRSAFYSHIVEQIRSRPAPHRGRVTRDDLLGALVCFWLVFFASVPAAVPFLFFDDPWTALRISNGVLLFLLFFAGYSWAKYTVANPWIAGISFLVGGLVMVLVAIALGG
jgi:hypothetical protein